MIESREQIGHRRMITSAPASAQSAFSWLGVAEREIKTIVPIEPFPDIATVTRSYPERSLPLFKIPTGKEYPISALSATSTSRHHGLAGQGTRTLNCSNSPHYVDGSRDPAYRENRALPSTATILPARWARRFPASVARLPAVSSGFLAFLRFTPRVS